MLFRQALGMCVIGMMVVTAAPARAQEDPRPIWLVVTRPALAEAITPLADHRRSEGFEIIISTDSADKALSGAGRAPAFILLVGDDAPDSEGKPWHVPAKRRKLYRWRANQREHFASDAAWGDLNVDNVPDIPVGRIPARTVAAVRRTVEKILRYERRPLSVDDLRILIWGGAPGYGDPIDSMATMMLLTTLQTGFPPWATPWVISGDPRHVLAGWPPDQPGRFCRQLQSGAGLCIMMGHGDLDSFYSMRHRGEGVVLANQHVRALLAKGDPGPPTLIFTCDSGDFAGTRKSLTEQMLLAPGGPVAVAGATTESHPLPNGLLGMSLGWQLSMQHQRVGDLWLATHRQALNLSNFLLERMLTNVEGSLEQPINALALRRDGALMYALLGDPATRLRLPRPLKIALEPCEAGWRWRVDSPSPGAAVEAGRRAEAWIFSPVAPDADAKAAAAAFAAGNATLAFTPVAAVAEGAGWTGTVTGGGLLRVVVVNDGRI